jgi:hypothetical protein
MRAELSVEESCRLTPSFVLRPAQRLAMVCMAYLPLLHVILTALILAFTSKYAGAGWGWQRCTYCRLSP